MDLFIFRCKACGKEAPEYEWGKAQGAQGMGRGGIVAFPKPVCPQCRSTNVDLNFDLRDARADEEERATGWRKAT
ncbi:MAG TPA: hypothetical protein VM681_10915 [Candidatus Thermoplasmatota archaeon]|nr:hypothetical protein [Candidatus Thermoplasmatota archaeon]